MTTPRDKREPDLRDVSHEGWVLCVAVITTGMAFIDATALNVALPAIQSDFHATGTEILWVINSYALFVAALLLAGGAMGDHLGQKRVYMGGIALFAVASLACGLAPSMQMLIAARALQGIGGAFMIPGSLAMITATVPPARRGKAIGVWTASSVVTTALGPLLGGLFARAGWWPGVFFINVPLALVALPIFALRAPNDTAESTAAAIDIWGICWSVGALAAANFGLIESANRGFSNGLVLTALLFGAISLGLFLVTESRATAPMLPLEVFRNQSLRVACLATLLFYSGLYGMTLFLSLNLIQLQKYDELQAGLALLPIILSVVVFSPWAGKVVDRRGPRALLILGPTLAGIGYFGLTLPTTTAGPADYWAWYLPPLMLIGCGMGITAVPLTATIMNALPPNHVGIASALNSALSRLSNVMGVAILGCVALFAFNHILARQALGLPLAETERLALADEAADLGNARPPAGLLPPVHAAVEQAIELSLVRAFRAVSYVCAGRVVASRVPCCMHTATSSNGVQTMQLIEVGSNAAASTLIVEEKPATMRYGGDATRSQPDSCWTAMAESGQESRCSLWWRNTPQLGKERVGIIGYYAADDDETAQALLAHACGKLRAHGCSLAVGPMNANTWSDYRFVTESGSEPQFWLEPANSPEWPQQLVRNNFQPLAQYFSALNERLDHQERGLDQVAQRLRAAGVRLRPVSEQSFDDDVRRIFSVARVAFRNNLLFSEPDEHEFICQSRPLRMFAALELSWIAEHHGNAVGFLFAVPDIHEEARLGRSQSVIIKTLAIIPERAYAGLGQLMLSHVQRHALKQGYTRAIHALMRDVGSMRRLSGRYARPMRRYSLFAKALTS